jgi:hypothetical protein
MHKPMRIDSIARRSVEDDACAAPVVGVGDDNDKVVEAGDGT